MRNFFNLLTNMAAFRVIVLALLVCLGSVLAHTHGRLDITPNIPLRRFYKLEHGASYVWKDEKAVDVSSLIRSFVDKHFGEGKEYVITNNYVTRHNGVRHVYLRQRLGDLEIGNSEANLNILDNKVLSAYGRFFLGDHSKVNTTPNMTAIDAAKHLATFLKIAVSEIKIRPDGKLSAGRLSLDPIPARLTLMQTDEARSLELCWNLVVRQENNWFDACVAQSGQIISLHDWVADATYLTLPISVDNPGDGERKLHTDVYETVASPLGWHDQGNGRTFTTTIGNNVFAQENIDGSVQEDWIENFRPSGGADNVYIFEFDQTKEPVDYVNASITNLFFWNNIIHDIFYQYGFDEVSGNFQENNFERGGLENDAVQANGQDGAGINNANFATPPDGERPRMRMYLYDMTIPYRDGDFAVGTVIHEYGHGISNRLTGGPANSNCLTPAESGGMGEGWSDFFSVLFRQRDYYTRDSVFPFGNWQRNLTNSIRPYDYATDMKINPTTYSFINGEEYQGVHAKGCVWATALYDGYWNIVDKYGFEPNLYSRNGGNGIVLQDVVDGLKFQPCRPTFLDARDGILLADETNYDGRHVCDWWRAFAKRGMGVNALSSPNGVIENFDLPATCL